MAILAAVAHSPADERVVAIAYDLASAYDETLYVMHAVREEEFEEFKQEVEGYEEFPDLSFTQREETAATLARKTVEDSVPDADLGTVETIGRVGSPIEQILTVADEVDARFLVIGGRRRSPSGKAIFGSVTQSVLLESTRPVVTVMRSE